MIQLHIEGWDCACGAKNHSAAAACRNCGASQASGRPSPNPPDNPPDLTGNSSLSPQQTIVRSPDLPASFLPSPPSAPAFRPCIVCGFADAHRVADIYSGTPEGAEFMGLLQPEDSAAGEPVESVPNARLLARSLAPPPAPRYRIPGTVIAAYLSSVIVVIFLVVGVDSLCATICSFGIALLIAYGIYQTRWSQRQFRLESFRHGDAMDRWQALVYCPRCHSVYNPQTRQVAPATSIDSLL